MSDIDERGGTTRGEDEEGAAPRRGRTLWLRLLYLAAIAAIVGSFFWQIAHGNCPVP